MKVLTRKKKTVCEVRFDQVDYTMEVEFERVSGLHRSKTPRIFLWGEPDPEDTSGSSFTEPPPYGSTRGDGSDNDKAWRKYNKEATTIMRAFSSAALDALGLNGLYETTVYNRHAGCSCSCSPGMNIKGLDASRANPILGTFDFSSGDTVTVNVTKVEE